MLGGLVMAETVGDLRWAKVVGSPWRPKVVLVPGVPR